MSMNCKIAADIAELYYEGLLSPETRKAVRRHLGGCQHCRDYYRQYEMLRKQHTSPVMQILPEDELDTPLLEENHMSQLSVEEENPLQEGGNHAGVDS